MKQYGSWLLEVQRLLLVLLVSAFLGWAIGYPAATALVGVLGLAVYWLYQMLKIRRWLSNTSSEPPEASGLWGAIFERVYRLQKQNTAARAQLQSTVDYLRDSFTSLRDGVVMVDADSAIEWLNPAAQRLLGLQFPRDKGQPLLNLVRYPRFVDYFRAMDFQQPLELELGDGSDRHILIEVTHFGRGDQLIFFRDITQMVRTQAMRRDFVGNVSHELRTPLTVIKGYLDVLSVRPDLAQLRLERPVEQMIQQADRMESLLADLLWLSRIESVRREEKVTEVHIPSLIEEVASELGHNHPGRIKLDIASDASVTGDYRELHSALTNLVSNALKYSDEEHPVTIHWIERDGEQTLEVKDRGIGIDRAHLPRVTERFFRVDESRSTESGGTGLGLAIVKHVAAAHEAELRIDSEIGIGSCFSLVFPVSDH